MKKGETHDKGQEFNTAEIKVEYVSKAKAQKQSAAAMKTESKTLMKAAKAMKATDGI